MLEIVKPDYNEEFRTVQFLRPDGKGQLAKEETITACQVLCIERDTGVDKSVEMVSGATPYDQTQAKYRLMGGVAGTVYILSVQVTTSTGQKLAEKFILRVV